MTLPRAAGAARAQGVAKQGLQRQKEAYAAKWRDLEERARGLEDALRSQRQAVQEREEQNSGLHAQVCCTLAADLLCIPALPVLVISPAGQIVQERARSRLPASTLRSAA